MDHYCTVRDTSVGLWGMAFLRKDEISGHSAFSQATVTSINLPW
ncbi:TPA: hypothetical protein ACGPH5_004318 [Escherichia coli]